MVNNRKLIKTLWILKEYKETCGMLVYLKAEVSKLLFIVVTFLKTESANDYYGCEGGL